MKVMILCGGQGTRLREHTELRPKPMVEVGGKPILWHILKLYAHYGFNDFILCLGYKGHVIKEYFLNYEAINSDFTVELGKRDSVEFHSASHQDQGLRVTLAETGAEALTGARIFRAAKYLDKNESTFSVTYGDGVSDVDLQAVLKFHREKGKLATLTGVRPPSRFGELDAKDGLVRSFSEKPQVKQGLINGGFFMFEKEFLRYLSNDDACILERGPLEACARDGQLSAYEHSGYWQCMDTYRDWQSLENQWLSGKAPWKTWS